MEEPASPTSPGLRLMDLIEHLVREGRPLALPEVVAGTGWPKPTVHRMLQQLEMGGWLQREPDGRRYALAPRLLLHASHVALRHPLRDEALEFSDPAPDLGLGGDFDICMRGDSHGGTVGACRPRSQEFCAILSLFVRYQTVTCRSLIYSQGSGRLLPTKPLNRGLTRQEK